MNATVRHPTVLRDWLMQMGRGAALNEITIQYCMSLPMHIMQSLEIPAVTQVRAHAQRNKHSPPFGFAHSGKGFRILLRQCWGRTTYGCARQ